MARLYSDQLQSSGRRYFFALDGAPGIVTPSPAALTLNGRQPIAVEPQTVFRTPATAVVTLSGLSFAAPTTVLPGLATLSTVGQIPGEQRILTISPALPSPLENPPAAFGPTLITIWATQPGVGLVRLQSIELNVTEGGNIGFLSPGRATLTLQSNAFSLLLLSGGVQAGLIAVNGLAPTLLHTLAITPEVGLVTMRGAAANLGLPFGWVDDDPALVTSWITDAAA